MIGDFNKLLEEIRAGRLKEHSAGNVELKRSWDPKYGNKISALANDISHPVSWLVVGVEDDGSLTGHSEKWARQTEESLSQALNTKLDPSQACNGVQTELVNGVAIVVAKFASPGALVRWGGSAYKKSGTTTAKMSPDEEMELTIRLPGLKDFTNQPNTSTLCPGIVSAFKSDLTARNDDLRSLYGDADGEELLRFLKIWDTNTARILLGDCPYRMVFYDADGNPVRNETRKGLYSLLSLTTRKEIQDYSRLATKTSTRSFPEKALKEALANAVAHAAYFECDGELIVEVYPNKIEISNLCLPESKYFANKWFSRSHKTQNRLLMESLRIAGYVDELGRGKGIIFSESIKSGKQAPIVSIEKSGRFDRWRLILFGGTVDKVQLRLLKRLREKYSSEQKALIAHALINWRDKRVVEIKKYIDGESAPYFAEVLGDADGPIFYYEPNDEIVLTRWVRILLVEGKDSKSFSGAEEKRIYDFAYEMCTKYDADEITPKGFRKYARMGETSADKTLSSNMLKKWASEGKIRKEKRGLYKFVKKPTPSTTMSDLLRLLSDSMK